MSPTSNHDHLDRFFESIENIDRASPSSDFEDRLYDRLEQLPNYTPSNSLTRWVRWSIAALLVLSFTNGYVIYQQQQLMEEEALEAFWTGTETDYNYINPEVIDIQP